MRTENLWREFRFWYSAGLTTSPDILDKLYRFKQKLISTIDQYKIEDFLILDEGKFFLLRVELSDEKAKQMEQYLRKMVDHNPDFKKLTVESWSPVEDAKTRILGARERAKEMGISFTGIPEGGWKIETRRDDRWIAKPDNLDLKSEKFATFMSRVVGKFTRAYLQEIPERVNDRWMLSVFIHLLLHSISEQQFERETRAFRWI